MRNKKNGSGKRVRTPITASAPKDKTKTQKKESSVILLLALGGIAVLATLLLAVGFIKVLRGDEVMDSKVSEVQVQAGLQSPAEITPADTEQVMDAVYLALFTFGLDKNSIKESTQIETDTEAEIRLKIDPFHIETIELRQGLSEKLTDIGMTVSDEDSIIASNGKVRLFIEFLESEIIDKVKPNSIAFVIDDCGYSLPLAKRLAALPYPVTMAVIPHTAYARQIAEIAREKGKTVFLHQPMQPLSYPDTDPGKGAILLNMPETIIQTWLDNNVENIGKIDGFNNHMGSALTQDSGKMKQVFKHMRKYTNTFVDSYTAQGTVAFDECRKAGYRCGMNRKFIDNENDYSYIRSKIIEGTEIARNDGSVIMIGHLRENTVDALEKIMPELEKAGYNLVSAAELAKK